MYSMVETNDSLLFKEHTNNGISQRGPYYYDRKLKKFLVLVKKLSSSSSKSEILPRGCESVFLAKLIKTSSSEHWDTE